jgi:uncharacterized membrane protein (Fun14 family)
VLTFVLPHRARVDFVVKQLAPVCRIVSRFRVTGRTGVNRLRFPRPTSRLTLDAGTYSISGQTRSGRLVERVTLVVFDRPPSAVELQAARSANVCSTPASLASSRTGSTHVGVARTLSPAGRPSASGAVLSPDSGPGGVLGSTAAQAARAIRPILVALLGLAIVLLGIASLPRLAFVDHRVNDVLARHRLEVAALGAAAFVAVLITLLVE